MYSMVELVDAVDDVDGDRGRSGKLVNSMTYGSDNEDVDPDDAGYVPVDDDEDDAMDNVGDDGRACVVVDVNVGWASVVVDVEDA